VARMNFPFNDGGRLAAGFKGSAGDCVVRAVAIATGRDYKEVYDALAQVNVSARTNTRASGKRSARNGVAVRSAGFKRYMKSLGWTWTPTMFVGQGCKMHLVEDELPKGVLIVALSKHYTTVIDGVIHDTFNPQRGPTYWFESGKPSHTSPDRCVYGYWQKAI
jgi:hypothetical protein